MNSASSSAHVACHRNATYCVSECQGRFMPTSELELLASVADEVEENLTMDYEKLKSKYPNLILFTASPSASPSMETTQSVAPTLAPTVSPSDASSDIPTLSPHQPTSAPSPSPSISPSSSPTAAPSKGPTPSPTALVVTRDTTESPTISPSAMPSAKPTQKPAMSPIRQPSPAPSATPTSKPSVSPSASPTPVPSPSPSAYDTTTPTATPFGSPTSGPTVAPSSNPTKRPTQSPTDKPTVKPTEGMDLALSDAQACQSASPDGKAVVTKLVGGSGETVILQRSSQLCTLWQATKHSANIIPVGRSYKGHEWEPSSGPFASVKFSCDDDKCAVTLPDLPRGYHYELAAFEYALPPRDENARFLEQSTYGPTREDLDSFPDSFAAWIKDQQENVAMTSHRQTFRTHVNYRQQFLTYTGYPTRPCERGARYRRYALVHWDTEVEFRTDTVTNRVLLADTDGFVRTVLNSPKLYYEFAGDLVPIEDGK